MKFGNLLQRPLLGQNSVLLNDVFASTHGVLVYLVIIVQCFIFEVRGLLFFDIFIMLLSFYPFSERNTESIHNHMVNSWRFSSLNHNFNHILCDRQTPLA